MIDLAKKLKHRKTLIISPLKSQFFEFEFDDEVKTRWSTGFFDLRLELVLKIDTGSVNSENFTP